MGQTFSRFQDSQNAINLVGNHVYKMRNSNIKPTNNTKVLQSFWVPNSKIVSSINLFFYLLVTLTVLANPKPLRDSANIPSLPKTRPQNDSNFFKMYFWNSTSHEYKINSDPCVGIVNRISLIIVRGEQREVTVAGLLAKSSPLCSSLPGCWGKFSLTSSAVHWLMHYYSQDIDYYSSDKQELKSIDKILIKNYWKWCRNTPYQFWLSFCQLWLRLPPRRSWCFCRFPK